MKFKNSILTFLCFLCFVLSSKAIAQHWQQKVDYQIDVTLIDSIHLLKGNVKITYHNNSPQTLTELYVHLWANAYQKNTELARQMAEDGDLSLRFAKPNELGYISDIDFKTSEKSLAFIYTNPSKEIAHISLDKGIKPGETFTFSTPFTVKVPGNISRMAHIENDYMITQWFPKVAMYDTDGWHAMPYLNWGEYYDNFGDYSVHITIPKNYVVAATGNLTTKSEIEWLKKRSEKSNEAIRKQDFSFITSDKNSSNTDSKTIHFEEKNVHDFAWFASKDFLVQNEQIQLNENHTVEAWSFFSPKAADSWARSIEYLSESVKHYSNYLGVYPYKNVSAVNGLLLAGGGMEYPTITVIGDVGSQLFRVILHEVGHNWFQGILATNERENPFMDEGLNTFYEDLYFDELQATFRSNPFSQTEITKHLHRHFAATQKDEANNKPAACYAKHNYSTVIYAKTAMAFRFLRYYLGEELFYYCMQNFYSKYKFKHPNPKQLQEAFEEKVLQNLDWFFKGTLGQINDYDAELVKYSKDGNVTIANNGILKMPIHLTVIQGGVSIIKKWIRPIQDDTTFFIGNNIDTIFLNYKQPFFETRTHNNNYFVGSGTKYRPPIKLKPIFNLNTDKQREILIGSAISANTTDGFGLGIYVGNSPFPQSKITWFAAPMQSFKSNNITGIGHIAYHKFKLSNKFHHQVDFGLEAKSFTYKYLTKDFQYLRLQPYIKWNFKSLPLRNTINHQIQLRSVLRNDAVSIINDEVKETNKAFYELSYTLKNTLSLFPYSLNIKSINHSTFSNLKAEWNGYIPFSEKKGVKLRAFSGVFLKQPKDNQYSMRLSKSNYLLYQSFDYMLDEQLIGRTLNNKLFNRQILDGDGFFKIPNRIYGSNTWMAAVNIESDLPGKIPFGIFIDAAYIPKNKELPAQPNGDYFYEAGLKLSIGKNILDIYWPILISDNIQKYLDTNKRNTWSLISFRLNLNELNLYKLSNRIDSFM